MASVLPRRTSTGSVSWRVQGRNSARQMRQETFLDETAARQFGNLVDSVGWDAAVAVRNARQDRDVRIPTLRQFTEVYLDPTSGHLSGITEATREGYRQIAERSFLRVIGDLPVDAITKLDVARWVTWQEAQPSSRTPDTTVAAKTIKNYHGVLSAILAAAVEVHRLDSNPARGTRLTRGQRVGITFLTRDEFNVVLHFVPDYYKPLALFLAGTGMRWGEATALTWADLDLRAKVPTARVDKAWKKGVSGPVLGPPKTKRSNRTISLWPELVQALGQPGPGGDLVFVGVAARKRMWSERFHETAWRPAVAAANDPAACAAAGFQPIGKRPRVHDLRHTHASWLIAAGAPLPYVQARLGHENISTTVDTYGHLLPDAHVQMAAIMSEAMSNVLPTVTPLSALAAGDGVV